MNKVKGYYLTIKDSQRHKNMKNKLDSINGLNYDFVFANNFLDDFVKEIVNPYDKVWHLSQFSNQESYLRRAYSCAEGHRRMMELFLNQTEYNWALIMEDDVDLGESIIDEINYLIDNNNENFYHLSTQAYYFYLHKIPHPHFWKEMPKVVKTMRGHSTLCYLCNKKFAMKYYKELCPISAPSDITLWMNNNICPCVENVSVYFSKDQEISEIGKII